MGIEDLGKGHSQWRRWISSVPGLMIAAPRVRESASLEPGSRDGKYLWSMLGVAIVVLWLFLYEELVTYGETSH